MKYLMFVLIGLLAFFANATSFGRIASANMTSIDNKPAICLPNDDEKAFSVGWISVYESHVQNPGAWGVALKAEAEPLVLKAGNCVVFGVVPEGYELDDDKVKVRPLKLQANKTYVFRLTDAYRPRDSYTAVFCVSQSTDGTYEYLQYDRLADGAEIVPSCDAKLNGNVPEQGEPLAKSPWPGRVRT
ncbi:MULTISPECIES: hypothetical protein [Pseudomonas]|uniref:hypothetical protein n=1 Tax=Pseudomonas TaxID=286 RepID=UPI001BE5C389|nr:MULTISPECIES: hypothetical protein [Pseudomonas]MBT2339752.1 hypothetical protein [Pseudomonas fluorescens]MCD4528538.1 hypothetical protein [Pseudomonas sp. C3-2018]